MFKIFEGYDSRQNCCSIAKGHVLDAQAFQIWAVTNVIPVARTEQCVDDHLPCFMNVAHRKDVAF